MADPDFRLRRLSYQAFVKDEDLGAYAEYEKMRKAAIAAGDSQKVADLDAAIGDLKGRVESAVKRWQENVATERNLSPAEFSKLSREAQDAFAKYDSQRKWLADVVHSADYARKAGEFEKLTPEEIQRRKTASLADIHLHDMFTRVRRDSAGTYYETTASGPVASHMKGKMVARFGEVPEAQRRQFPSGRFQDENLAVHELEHAVTDGGVELSPYATKLYNDSALASWGDIPAQKRQIFADPSEIDARKRQLEYDLEQNGVWKYGDKFSSEHFQKAQALEKAGKLSDGAADIIRYIKPEKLLEIINTIAENRFLGSDIKKPVSV